MKSLSRFAFAILFILLASRSVRANTDPPTWIDVQNYSADPTCATDSSTAINNAIASVSTSSAGAVIFFPTGCYLIGSTIVDNIVLCSASPCTASNGKNAPGITYLGFGRVELRASSSLTGSILKLGDDTHTIDRRRLSNFFLDCNPPTGSQPSIIGIVIDGLRNSQFDDVEIKNCPVAGLAISGNNSNNYSNVFEGGGVVASASGAKGVVLTYGTNNWTFKGTRILNTTGTSSSVGLEFEGAGNVCIGCDIAGWSIGLAAAVNNLGQSGDGLDIDGGYYEDNVTQIRLGQAAVSGAKIHGVSIHGAYFHISSGSSTACIDLEQADGFIISGNQFLNCGTYNIAALADASNQGADNGIIANNSFNGSATNSLLGSNITLIAAGQITQINSASNCSATSNPASCSSYANGSVTIAAGSNSVTVNSSAVTAKSQILVTFDSSLGAKLGTTCNTTFAAPYVSARTAGTSFNIAVTSAPSTNPACFSYSIVN